MKVLNKTQIKERLIHIFDGYVKAQALMKRKFDIDWENDSDIVEWTKEEVDSGCGYFQVFAFAEYSRGVFIENAVWASKMLDIECVEEDRHDSEYPYKYSFIYKGCRFFGISKEKML